MRESKVLRGSLLSERIALPCNGEQRGMVADRLGWNGSDISDNQRRAMQEAFSCYVVGVFPNDGRETGTGTLIEWNGHRYVLTAWHVLNGVKLNEVRFHTRQAGPIQESTPEETLRKQGHPTRRGEKLDIVEVVAESDQDHDDLKVLELASSIGIEAGAQFYQLLDSQLTIREGVSILTIGYAFDGAVEFAPGRRGIVATADMAPFNSTLNARTDLHSSYKSERHFLLPYNRTEDGITPFGFSGAGAWYNTPPKGSLWAAQPTLAGVVTRWHREPNLLQVTNLESILQLFRQLK
jgi:hypothetical protein